MRTLTMPFKITIVSVFITAFALLSVISAPGVLAQTSPEASVDAEETIESGFRAPSFFADDEVTLSETYFGPVFAFGGQVTLDGEVQGDLIVAGGSVEIGGRVLQDVYVAGGTVYVTGIVDGNVISAGGEVHFAPTAEIGESVIIGGENVVVDGRIAGQVHIGARQTMLSGTIQGDTQSRSQVLRLGETASLAGTLTGEVADPVVVPDTATVAGGVEVSVVEKTQPTRTMSVQKWLVGFFWTLLSYSIVLLLATKLLGSHLVAASLYIKTNWKQVFFPGIVLFMALLLGSLFFLLTFVGALVGVMGVIVLLGLSTTGWILSAFALGYMSLPDQNLYVQALLGALLAAVLVSIPFVGWVFGLILAVAGMGTMYRLLSQ